MEAQSAQLLLKHFMCCAEFARWNGVQERFGIYEIAFWQGWLSLKIIIASGMNGTMSAFGADHRAGAKRFTFPITL